MMGGSLGFQTLFFRKKTFYSKPTNSGEFYFAFSNPILPFDIPVGFS